LCGGLAAAAGSIIARSTAQRPETRRKPRAFRGTDAKEFPILAADYAADLLKRVARAEPERVNAREWIILLYSAVFILVTWFLAVLLAIYNRNTSPTGLKARRAQELRGSVEWDRGLAESEGRARAAQ